MRVLEVVLSERARGEVDKEKKDIRKRRKSFSTILCDFCSVLSFSRDKDKKGLILVSKGS